MTTLTALNRTTSSPNFALPGSLPGPAPSASGTVGDGASTVVSLNNSVTDSVRSKALVWENRTRSASAALMARNIAGEQLSERLNGLGSELLKQVAYDGGNFSQAVQEVPGGAQSNTYDMLVSPSSVSPHGRGDSRIGLTVTTRSGVKLELKLDADAASVAVAAHADGKLNELERKALGELATAFQSAIDGWTQDPPRIDISRLTRFDNAVLSSVELQGQVKINSKDLQHFEFQASGAERSLNVNGPAGSAKIKLDLSKPVSWGDKEQQAKSLNHYLRQIDQASMRGQGNGAMVGIFKNAFTEINSDYGTPLATPPAITLMDQDRALTTGMADFSASFTQTVAAPNPARGSEQDGMSYELSQKSTITGTSQKDRSISQLQQSHLRASYHAPAEADTSLALTLSPGSQNYKYVTIDDTASSATDISYARGLLAKATLTKQANQSTSVARYALGKLQDVRTTPHALGASRDLLTALEPERLGLPPWSESRRLQGLAELNSQILLQQNPDTLGMAS